MYRWNEMVQLMIDWIDEDITAVPTLLKMANQLGYSPYYCTKQFHSLTGVTLRDYTWMRRISRAALELRDTDNRILDIAIKFGFSSQEAFSRAFVKAFNITPYVYQKSPRPIPLAIRAEVFSPYHYLIRERDKMRKVHLQEAEIKLEFIPAHKFIGIWDSASDNYGQFWGNGHDCDEISGTLESMSHHTIPGQLGQTAGWFYQNGHKGYLYGIPASSDYKRHFPEGYGYAVLRPVKKLG